MPKVGPALLNNNSKNSTLFFKKELKIWLILKFLINSYKVLTLHIILGICLPPHKVSTIHVGYVKLRDEAQVVPLYVLVRIFLYRTSNCYFLVIGKLVICLII